MKKEKKYKKRKTLIQIFIIFIIVISFISVSWLAIFYEINNYKENIISSFQKDQYLANSELADRIEITLNDYINNKHMTKKDSEEKAVNQIIEKETNSQNKYVFFYRSDSIIFEENASNTKKYSNKSLKQLFDLWRYEGGSSLDNAQKLMNSGISGTDEVIKNNKKGREIISWCFFETSNQKYIIGLSTSEDYLMRINLVNQHILRIYVFAGIYSALLIIISIAFSLHIYFAHKKEIRLKNELKNKNIQIEEFMENIDKLKKIAQTASIYDGLTGVYNKKFFYTIVSKMDTDVFLPILILRVKINNLKSINYNFGYEKGDEILKKTARILLENLRKSDIVSRINDSEFGIIMVNTDEKYADSFIVSVKQQVEKTFGVSICDISFKAAVKNYQMENLLKVIDNAKNGVTLDE